ncbi:MAG: ferredoxin [Litoreibacter sp.]|nr:ferredoxin [Litoreibacter sp.]
MTFDDLLSGARARHLDIFGAFHPTQEDNVPHEAGTLLLLGPHEPGFWEHLTASAEWQSAGKDPVDRWSRRVIGEWAGELGTKAFFPFTGPPYHPFFSWALRSGQAWQSPVSLLVHSRAGLMVSYRGALTLKERLDLPAAVPCPCETCEQPCLTACPAGALGADGYDVAACHDFLDTPEGKEIMDRGCAVRRSCPVSQSYGRLEAQSAYHMSVFHR